MGGFKMMDILTLPFAVDALQVITEQKAEFDPIYLLIALVPSVIGASVRIAHESDLENKTLVRRRMVYIYICSLFMAYIISELTIIFKIKQWLGLACIIGGLISVDIVKLFVKHLSKLLWRSAAKKILGDDRELDD